MEGQLSRYTLIRTNRKTLALQIKVGGELFVRAPYHMSVSIIEDFISKKQNWIKKNQEIRKQKSFKQKDYSPEKVHEMKNELMHYLSLRVKEIHKSTGLPKYTSLKITSSNKRWGSCSGNNGLCFSYRLAEYLEKSPLFIDAIIYHELAHLKEKNHGKNFWNLLLLMMPEYKKILKNHHD